MRCVVVLLSLVGCGFPETGDDSRGLLGTGLLDPFPSIHLLDDDGRVALPADDMPESDTPFPAERIAWRTGFSPVQTAVVRLPDVDADALPSWRTPTPGEGGVLLVDLDAGTFLPVMAELDAHPDAAEAPTLIVRPQVAMTYGHQVAVVVTTEAAARPERFDALVSGRPPADFAHRARHYRDLMDQLDALGVDGDDVALAWDFPVARGTAPLTSAIAALQPPGAWSFTTVRDADLEERVARDTWRAASGTFRVQSFLVDDRLLELGPDGEAVQTGEDTAPIYVHIPDSVKDAPAGTVPILVYGHGIFGHEADALDLPEGYASPVTWLAQERGFIVVSTAWRGLDAGDQLGPVEVAWDFGKLPLITDRMVQGQVNVVTMIRMITVGDLLTDPVFLGASGQVLPDPSQISFYGISMGGVLGGVLMAQEPAIDAGVLHLGGGAWSTLLERSSAWAAFEPFLEQGVADPADRQLLYAGSQLFWDAADPAAYVPDLEGRTLLYQENIGDESVHNIGTTVLARSLGLTVLSPEVAAPVGLSVAAGPFGPGSRALVQMDPKRGEPPDTNRPSSYSGAHNESMGWEGTRAQIRDFLAPTEAGRVVHHCGDSPCTRFNQGSLD